MKKILLSLSLVLVLALGSVAVFAADPQPAANTGVLKNNVQILDEMIALNEEEIIAKVKAGTSLSAIAKEYGVFDAFTEAIKENRIQRIELLVTEGRITRERADQMIQFMKDHLCDGTQQYAMRYQLNNGEKFGLGFGRMNAGSGLASGNADGTQSQNKAQGRGFGPAAGGRGMMNGAGGFGGQCVTGAQAQ